jgi:hypothetical protein
MRQQVLRSVSVWRMLDSRWVLTGYLTDSLPVAVNARFLAASFSGTAMAAVLAALLAAYGMLVTLASPRSGLLETHLQTQNYRAAQVPAIVRQAWKAGGIYCDTTGLPLYQYSTAATGLPGRLSQRAEDCRQPAKANDAH